MSARLFLCVSLFGLCAVPGLAVADGLVITGIGPSDQSYGRPSYRETGFPPVQHNLIGQPVPPPSPYDRPSYREGNNDFPPAGGRYGGGFIEYMMTGGRPEPVAPQAYEQDIYPQQPAYAPPPASGGYNPAAALLPQSGLPDYQPQPQAFFGSATQGQAPQAQAPQAQAPQGQAPQAQAYTASRQLAYNTPGAEPIAAEPGLVGRQVDPMFYRQDVAYEGHERPGTIIIDTPQKFLFLVEPGGHALRYGIGVGRPGFTWAGVKRISRKAEWPGWTPPHEMLLRRPDLPRHMTGGMGNPLGARALYLGSSLYRIHGTNEPTTIGMNVSSGCIRMMNGDVEDLYSRVGVGTRVIVQ